MPNTFKTSGDLKAAQGRIALLVAGDNVAAKAIVLRLVDQLGFDRVDAGRLDESWRQQAGAPVYAADFDADGVQRALAKSSRERATEWRATPRIPQQLRSAGLTETRQTFALLVRQNSLLTPIDLQVPPSTLLTRP